MSRNNQDLSSLTKRDKEFVALGAAIASNCIPCIEYHIPQARKIGLSDSEIGEAIALADKVRRVPADKVLQTAFALLEKQNRTRIESQRHACGCPDGTMNSAEHPGNEPVETRVDNVRLESESSKEDNEMSKEDCCDNSDKSFNPNSPKGAAGSPHAADQTGFDFSKMMGMMQRCCPDEMKNFSSIMSNFESGCCSPNEEAKSKESA